MSDKKKVFLAGAIVAWGILVVLLVWNMCSLRDLQMQVGGISLGGDQSVSYEEALPPSILASQGLNYLSKEPITGKNTIEVKASVVPLKFKKGTRAYIKMNEKKYELKQKDNKFTGRFPVSIFEPVSCDLVLEDDDNVRTESLEGLDPYIPMNFTWSLSGIQPSFTKDGVSLDQTISPNSSDRDISAGEVVGMVDGKQVYKKSFTVEYSEDELEQDIPGFELKDNIDLPKGKTLQLYVVTKAKQGYTYRYLLGTLKQGENTDDWMLENGQAMEVLNPSGKSVMKKTAEEIHEDEF